MYKKKRIESKWLFTNRLKKYNKRENEPKTRFGCGEKNLGACFLILIFCSISHQPNRP